MCISLTEHITYAPINNASMQAFGLHTKLLKWKTS